MKTQLRWTLALLLSALLIGCGGGALQRGNAAFASGQFDLAAQQWNPLANAGDPDAQYNLGLIWESGLGSTPKNDSNAADWFIQSARQGYVPAMIKLAQTQTRMGYNDSALSWYVMAARWGSPEAQTALRTQNEPVPSADLLYAQQQQNAVEQQQLNHAAAQLGASIGCALGGGCVSPQAPRPQSGYQYQPPRTVAPLTTTAPRSNSCTSDYSCGTGFKCIKKPSQSTGQCLKEVDRYGTPTYSPPSPASIGPNINPRKQCQISTDCPIGFRCDATLKVCAR